MMNDLVNLYVLLALLFVGSMIASSLETALTGANVPRFKTLAKRGDRRAQHVLSLVTVRDRVVVGILVANNVFNIGASSLVTVITISYFDRSLLTLVITLFTVLMILFAEVLPKVIALRHADTIILKGRYIAHVCMWIGNPISYIFSIVTPHKDNIDRQEQATQQREILEGAIDMHAAESGDHHERSLLHSILDISDIDVGDAMNHRSNVYTVDVEDPNALERILGAPYRRIPIFRQENENICGVIDQLELLKKLQQTNTQNLKPETLISLASPPWFVPSTASSFMQLRRFRRSGKNLAIVVDEYGSFEGIITVQDILDEIFGEENRKHNAAVSTSQESTINSTDRVLLAGVTQENEHAWIVDGDVSIRALNRELGWDFDEDDHHTIAGFLINLTRKIPNPGEHYTNGKFSFEILGRQRNRITKMRITLSNPSEAEDSTS